MKTFFALVLAVAGSVSTQSYAGEYWIRPDGTDNTGSGTAADPWVRSSATSFDDLMNSSTIPENSTIHLMAGTFHTEDTILVKNGWKIKGAGMEATTVVFAQTPHTNTYWFSVFQGRRVDPNFPNDANQEVSDLTVNCNLAGQAHEMVVNAAILVGSHSAIRRVRAINWGTSRQTASLECFVLLIQCWDPTTTGQKHNVIEDCIVEQPAEVTFHEGVTPIMIGGGNDTTTTPGAGWITDAEIRACYVGNITVNANGGTGTPKYCNAYQLSAGVFGGRIRGNIAVNLDGGRGVYIDTGSIKQYVVENNLLLNVTRGIQIGVEEYHDPKDKYSDVFIRDNVITLISGGKGIYVNSHASSTPQNVIISGNHVRNEVTGQNASAFEIYQGNQVFVAHNMLDTTGGAGGHDYHIASTVQLSNFGGNYDSSGGEPIRLNNPAPVIAGEEQIIRFFPTAGPGWYRLLASSSWSAGLVRIYSYPWSQPKTDLEFHYVVYAYETADLDHVGEVNIVRFQKHQNLEDGGFVTQVRVGNDGANGFLDVYISNAQGNPANVEFTVRAMSDKALIQAPGIAPSPTISKTVTAGRGLRTTGPIYSGFPQRRVTDLTGRVVADALGSGAADDSKFLRGDQTWAAPAASYTLPFMSVMTYSPLDSTTYYMGWNPGSPGTTYSHFRTEVPKSGTLKRVFIRVNTIGVGSSEAVTHYVRINDTIDVAPISIAYNSTNTEGSNSSVNQQVAAGDYVALKVVTPTWATNPTNVRYAVQLYIE